MTPEAQRIAIAEACGKIPAGFTHHTLAGFASLLPDYLNDLNAMHAAEEVLTTGELRAEFQMHLGFLAMKEDNRAGEWFLVHSTAAQRAEAFLQTLNLWTE